MTSNRARLDTDFSAEGVWWEPSDPSRTFHGTLTCNQGELYLLARDNRILDRSKERVPSRAAIPLFHGVLDNSLRVSLGYSTPIHSSARPVGVGLFALSERFQVFGAITGVHLKSTNVVLSSVRVSYQNLEEWARLESFQIVGGKPTDDALYTITLQSSKPVEFRVPTVGEIEIQTKAALDSIPSWKRAGIEVELWLAVRPNTPKPYQWFNEKFWALRLLLSTLIGSPTLARAIEGTIFDDDVGNEVDVGILTWDPRRNALGPVSWRQVAFPLPTVVADSPDFFERWFQSMSKVQTTAELFIGALANSQTYPHQHFLALVHALEILHRHTQPGTYLSDAEFDVVRSALGAIPTSVSGSFKDVIKGRLGHMNEQSLKTRLMHLASLIDPALKPAISEDLPAFIRRVVDTRNYFTHWRLDSKHHPFTPEELPEAASRLTNFHALLLLREMGLSTKTVQKVFISPQEGGPA